ncbi:MAG: uracil-DNA glycosylase family protein, partial [Dongiaceae bacterium]
IHRWDPDATVAVFPSDHFIREEDAFLRHVAEIMSLVEEYPELLVLLGAPSAQTILARTDGISRLRGRWFPYQSAGMAHPVPAMPTYHPAYLLRQPGQKRAAWRDWLAILSRLKNITEPSIPSSHQE